MCGVGGFFNFLDGNKALSKSIEKALWRRGPDSSGISSFKNSSTSLVHTRLEIMDLGKTGIQPAYSVCNRYAIIFNGEIYNYKDLSKKYSIERPFSEADVILFLFKKFGTSAFNKLNGMFSIVIYDIYEDVIYLTRDRFGVKPLYFIERNNSVFFASEIGVLRELFGADVPRPESFMAYLKYGISDNSIYPSLYEEIQQIDPGKCFKFTTYGKAITTYYSVLEKFDHSPYDLDPEELMSIVQDSVILRANSDVNFVLNLSGGVDSSIIHLLLSQHNISNYSALYTASYNKDDFDSVNARNFCKLTEIDLEHNIYNIEVPNLLHEIKKHQGICDGPVGGMGTIGYAKLHDQISKSGYKMALDGQGSDEILLGYKHYSNNSPPNFETHIDGTLDTSNSLLMKEFELKKPSLPQVKSYVRQKQYFDIIYSKLPRVMRMNDRLSMYYGIELREPFLDFRIFDATVVQSVGSIMGDQGKDVFRKIYKKYTGLNAKAKNSAAVPQKEIMLHNKELINQFLKRNLSVFETISLDMDGLKKVIYNDNDKLFSKDNTGLIWRLINGAILLDANINN